MKYLLPILCGILLASCATPAIQQSLLERGRRDIAPIELSKNPGPYLGGLFIFGGVIADTRLTADGTLIEALYLPVDRSGYLVEDGKEPWNGRYLAFYPKERGFLDPLLYGQGRRITVAGTFIETRMGEIGQMSYVFPVLRVEDLRLWNQGSRVYPNTFFNFGVIFGF